VSFDERMAELDLELKDITIKNKEVKDEGIDWKAKYEELLKKGDHKQVESKSAS
jgi:hypothetical protein